MKGHLRVWLPPYGVMLPVKWNRLRNYAGVTTVAASELRLRPRQYSPKNGQSILGGVDKQVLAWLTHAS